MMIENDETVWTPKAVGDCIVEAVKWANRAGGRVGPAGYRSNMPALLFGGDDRIIEKWPEIRDLEPEPMRRAYAPWQVSQFERVIGWPMDYLAGMADKDPEACWFFRVWVESKTRKGMKFDKMLDAIGVSRATAYRKRDKILSTIAKGLTRDRIERGRH